MSLKRSVELIGQRVLLKSWWFGSGWLFFSSLYFLFPLLEICVKSIKNQSYPLIYLSFNYDFLFFYWSFFVLDSFLDFFLFHLFPFDLILFLYQIWHLFSLFLFFHPFLGLLFFLLILTLNILFHFFLFFQIKSLFFLIAFFF